jgi:hypothetical protein
MAAMERARQETPIMVKLLHHAEVTTPILFMR